MGATKKTGRKQKGVIGKIGFKERAEPNKLCHTLGI